MMLFFELNGEIYKSFWKGTTFTVPELHYIGSKNVHWLNVAEMWFCLQIDFFRIPAIGNSHLWVKGNLEEVAEGVKEAVDPLFETTDLIVAAAVETLVAALDDASESDLIDWISKTIGNFSAVLLQRQKWIINYYVKKFVKESQ